MSTSLDPLRQGSKQAIRRMRCSTRRGQRPAVERLEDYLLLSTFTVTNTNDQGTGSFRQAWNLAINSGVASTIDFQIGTQGVAAGPLTITIGGGNMATGQRLPTMRVPITVDGWSEGDWQNGTSRAPTTARR